MQPLCAQRDAQELWTVPDSKEANMKCDYVVTGDASNPPCP